MGNGKSRDYYLNEYAKSEIPTFGLEIPERLFWEAYVMRQDITRVPGSDDDTGRPSEPAFQDMNFAALRKPQRSGQPRAVLYQHSVNNSMSPLDLLVAYEGNSQVLPIVSDFDCFTVGTRGGKYTHVIPDDQIKLVNWCLTRINTILDEPPSIGSWTSRWLEALKSFPMKVKMPEYGFGDMESYRLMKLAVGCLSNDGSVRHGAECFNYYFPQELDEHFLVIGDGLNENNGPPWCYVDVASLQKILLKKVNEGYTFPLNPKWVVCDLGWKDIYDAQMASGTDNVQDSLKCWYPPYSGIREKIETIHKIHPEGFTQNLKIVKDTAGLLSKIVVLSEDDGTSAMDLAELELKNHETLQRSRKKLRAALVWMSRLSKKVDTNCSKVLVNELDVVK